eukprot:CAMPEP_0201560094 /NCGR_PEP_ID=MMETSP0173_2-20130828/78084_1 /ASSEMBLY_ACC=CAM_ASM_000268 /TAXON_ID=218659 /ORGANISM="Vexillifera sp., Strain DIVA3 564/2" /LENGTH=447 /DNA_ID=CAMNT_0047974523 /DNA_START=27 /DNA_END=1370 /DNA_ORIENTATION=+
MDENYDCIVLGTSLKECILSGLLSVHKYKVLHMDRNNYYGGDSASLQLNQLYEQYTDGKKPPAELGNSRDWNIDLVPKLIMSAGQLVQMLIHTDVAKYLEFKLIGGSYVVAKDKKVHKVPATDGEALRSGLLGLLEKNRARKFFQFLQNCDPDDQKTWNNYKLQEVTMDWVYNKFSLSSGTKDFIGHALALHTEDDYLEKPALPTIKKIRLYFESLARHAGPSPYLYPLYGLGELPQGFARLSAIYGGTYMLDRKIEGIEYDKDGHFVGVKADGSLVKAKFVVGDPSYFPDKVKKVGQVVRSINIIKRPIENTKDADSVQVIIPQNSVGRNHDIYVSMVSSAHNIAAKGYYVAMVSTTVETKDPVSELKPGLDILGDIVESFTIVKDVYEPISDGTKDQVFISTSYDATSHFETSSLDIADIWQRITGKPLDLSKKPGDGAASSKDA